MRHVKLLFALLAAVFVLAPTAAAAGAVTPFAAPTWTNQAGVPFVNIPQAGTAMAYNEASEELLIAGGVDPSSGGYSQRTSELSKEYGSWINFAASAIPQVAYAAMAYDPAIGKTVLFGGQNSSGALSGTYVWTDNWTQLSPQAQPPARSKATLAYDPRSKQLLLFGGTDGSGHADSDTWAFDGTTWTQLVPAHSPPSRSGASMAFDAASNQLILFGGTGQGGQKLGDTWTWTGTDWTQLTTTHAPSARTGSTLTYDPQLRGPVLFSGNTATSAVNETWLFNGSDWSQLVTPPAMGARADASAAYYPAVGGIVTTSGVNGTTSVDPGQVWTYRVAPGLPTAWRQLTPAAAPPARLGPASAVDPIRNKTVLFGGYSGADGSTFGDTWEWDGTTWTQRFPATSPSARSGAAMAFDATNGDIVLMGGNNGSTLDADTWTYDGTNWTHRTPTHSPPALSNATAAYDPISNQVILFGGYTSGVTAVAQTWGWDGNDWTQLTSTDTPPARYLAQMAFDPALGKIVLSGGTNAGNADTWTWSGYEWDQVTTATGLPHLVGGGAAYDPTTRNLLLGLAYSNNFGTWAFDGTTWTRGVDFAGDTPGFQQRGEAAVTNDPVTGRVLTFGGGQGPSQLDDTWTYGAIKATPTVAITPSAGVTVGSSIGVSAAVSDGQAPSGTITFRLYPPTDAACSGTPTVTSSLSSGSDIEPDSVTTTHAGTYHWTATYDGDGSNVSVATDCAAGAVNVAKQQPTLTNVPTGDHSNHVTVGNGALRATATLDNGYAPAGSITFRLYGPNDATCSAAPVFTSTVATTGNGAVTSADYAPTTFGTYRWTASFGGSDTDAVADVTCGSALTVNANTPALYPYASGNLTLPGGTTESTAILAGGLSPGGTFTFSLYGPTDPGCTGTPLYTHSASASDTTVVTSSTYTPTAAGAYEWVIAYSGDAANAGIATECGALSVDVSKASQQLTFGAIADRPLGTATDVALTATATSALAPTFVSTTPLVCTVSGTTARLVKVGTCSITASQAGDATYVAATPVSRSFAVTDVIPPTLSAPVALSVDGTGTTTAVSFDATATDDVDGSVAVRCDPASGSQFPVGATVVTCTASDAAGNAATTSFTVTVTAPQATPTPTPAPDVPGPPAPTPAPAPQATPKPSPLPVAITKLSVAVTKSGSARTLTAKATVTRAARLVLAVQRKKGKSWTTLRTASANGRAGTNTVSVKTGALARGSYRAQLTATTTDGATIVRTATFAVR